MSEAPSEMPVTDESEVDEPTSYTTDPDFSRGLKDGIGFHDEEATVFDTELPDLDTVDEPTVTEPDEEVS